MTVFHQPKTAQNWVHEQRAGGRRIGLVPTMGALHEGHLALVRHARSVTDSVVASIFVNPTQFGPNEDFSRYPRMLERDLASLEAEGVAAVFTPGVDDMYPAGYGTFVEVEDLTDVLEGAIRPGHYRGVATIVLKLFHIVPPDAAVFGQKDYQQLLVIRKMARDLNLPIDVLSHPTVRESDGLALSSRNAYLSAEERQSGLALSQALWAARMAAGEGTASAEDLERAAHVVLDAEPGLVVEYAVVRDPETLKPLPQSWERAVCLVAARAGSTRLIDNMLFDRNGLEVFA